MLNLIEKGVNKVDDGKFTKYPIFENLYNMKYQWEPEKWKNADYDKFLKEVRKPPKVDDTQKMNMDQYDN